MIIMFWHVHELSPVGSTEMSEIGPQLLRNSVCEYFQVRFSISFKDGLCLTKIPINKALHEIDLFDVQNSTYPYCFSIQLFLFFLPFH